VSYNIDSGVSNIPNILDNGGFEVWQRGTSFSTPANNAYTVDRWKVSYNNSPTFTVTQESSTIDSGLYSMKLNITAVGSAQYLFFNQPIENFQAYRGKTITVSIRVNSNVSGIYLAISDAAATYSSLYSTPGSWQTLTVTRTVSTSAATLNVTVGFDSTVSGQPAPSISASYFDSAMLVVGPVPGAFIPTNPQIEFSRCQRYYEIGDVMNFTGYNSTGGTTPQALIPFRTNKRVAPTITAVYNSNANVTSFGVGGVGLGSFQIQWSMLGTGQYQIGNAPNSPWSASADI
jgi:hypothetical protein